MKPTDKLEGKFIEEPVHYLHFRNRKLVVHFSALKHYDLSVTAHYKFYLTSYEKLALTSYYFWL